mmetsp:Transcript_14031/g.23247  ORF Transcript_14031/g.23247 Transcript_14031/m.23247 type:complete len:168 (+) Transcript_14031:91-594(+)
MPLFPPRTMMFRSCNPWLSRSFATNKGIFVPSKAWPAVTKAGHSCKKCTSLDKNHFCIQHGHLGIKELVDKKSRGYFIPNKCWPAKTKKNEECKQCAKFTPGYFCHHHTAAPLASLTVSPLLTPSTRSPLLDSFSVMSPRRSPRFYEIAAFTTLATEFVAKTVSCSQ